MRRRVSSTPSTYLNELVAAGFTVRRLVEPTLPAGHYDDAYRQGHAVIPSVMVVEAMREDDAR